MKRENPGQGCSGSLLQDRQKTVWNKAKHIKGTAARAARAP